MVMLPTLEDGKGTIREHCEFGETVRFHMPGKLKIKADTAWRMGIWLGKGTEADESIVQIVKVLFSRFVPSRESFQMEH